MLPAKVFLYAGQIPQRPRGVVVDACLLGANIYAFTGLLAAPLLELPGEVVASAVKLEVLVPLKPFPAYLAQEPVRGHQGLRRQSDDFSFWI